MPSTCPCNIREFCRGWHRTTGCFAVCRAKLHLGFLESEASETKRYVAKFPHKDYSNLIRFEEKRVCTMVLVTLRHNQDVKRSLQMTALVVLLCRSVNSFAIEQTRWTHSCLSLHEKRPKLADKSAVWPSNVDLWALDWQEPDICTNSTACLIPSNGCWVASVSNENPTWERILAKVIPENCSVSPASATLAPRGGCDNLCNDEERYTDSCNFSVPYSP
jgi:hypothetical protein